MPKVVPASIYTVLCVFVWCRRSLPFALSPRGREKLPFLLPPRSGASVFRNMKFRMRIKVFLCISRLFFQMKRSATAAQLKYPGQNRAAIQRRKWAGNSAWVSNAGLTPVQKKQARAIAKRAIARDADVKYCFDYSGVLSISSSGGGYSILNNLLLGDQKVNQFNGSKIIPKELTVNWVVDFTPCISETGVSYESARWMIIQNRGQQPASSINAASYMQLGVTSAYAQLSTPNFDEIDNWVCLYDSGPMSMVTTAGFTGGSNSVVRTGSFRITNPVTGRKVMNNVFFEAGDATGNNVERNDIVVIFFGDSSIAPHPVLAIQSLLTFTDGA